MSAARDRAEMELERDRESGVVPRREAVDESAAPRIVYTQAPVQVGVLAGREGDGWRVRTAAGERVIAADPSVDPALLDEVARDGGRVLIDAQGEAVIVSALLTRRPLTLDRDGHVAADVQSFTVKAVEHVMLQTGKAFVQLRGGRMELFAVRMVQRARERVRILARQIGLN